MHEGIARRTYSYIVCLVLVCLLVSAVAFEAVSHARSPSLRDEIQGLNDRLSQIQSNIDQYQRNLGQLQNETAGVSRELGQTQLELQTVEAELERAEVTLEIAELEVVQAAQELEEAERELDRRIDLLHRRVRAMYELGTVSYLEVLLSATSFTDFVKRFQMLREIVDQDVSIVEAVSEQRSAVEEHKLEWEAREAEASEWRSEVASKRSELRAQVAGYERRLDALTSQQREYRDALDEMERRSEQITQEIIDKQQQLALEEGIVFLDWPMDSGTYWISSPFGRRFHPVLGEWRLHSGVDMAASSGTTIRAAGPGVVLDAGWMGGYGLTVIIAHTSNLTTLYAHASTLLVSGGDDVAMGQAIARVGSTGLSTGPHLHFEVRVDGEPQNPIDFLPPR